MMEYIYLIVGAASLLCNVVLIILFIRLNKNNKASSFISGNISYNKVSVRSNKPVFQSNETEAMSEIPSVEKPVNLAPETEILDKD